MKFKIICLLLGVFAAGMVLGGCGKSINTTTPSSAPSGDVTPPAIPSGLICIAGNATVDISWEVTTLESDLAGYNIYRSATSGSNYVKVATVKFGGVYWDSGLAWPNTDVTPYQANTMESGPLAYPNPCSFASSTVDIQYILFQDSNATLEVYNVNSEKICKKEFLSGSSGGAAGLNKIVWDGKKSDGTLVREGIYPFQIISDGFRALGGGGTNVKGDYIVAMGTTRNMSNDITYYYVLAAYDTASNESGYSAEAAATPSSSNKYTIWKTRLVAGSDPADPIFEKDN